MPKEAKAQAVFVSSYGVWVAVQSKHQRIPKIGATARHQHPVDQTPRHGESHVLQTNHVLKSSINYRKNIENVAHSSG